MIDLRHLHFDMSRPCNACPYRRDNPPEAHAAVMGGAARIRDELAPGMRGGAFACHKTTVHDPEDPDREIGSSRRTRACAGALIVLEKQGTPSWLRQILMQHDLAPVADLDLSADTYESLDEMIEVYSL